MDIKGMHYFISAAENLSFTKAAIEHNITQTAISLSISRMEEELGFQLFSRNKRSVQLTEAGRDFYEQIVYVVTKYEEAVEHSMKTASGKVGEIRIGVPDCIMGMSLISAIRTYQQTIPQMNIKIIIVSPQKAIHAIETHDIDAAIGFVQEFEANVNLQYRVFRKDKLVLAMAPHHPLALCQDITIEQLSSQTITVVNPQKAPLIYRHMCQIWGKVGFKPHKILHAANLDNALLETAIGNAVLLISEYSQPFCSPSLIFRRLKEFDKLNIEIAIAWSKTRNNPFIRGLVWALLENA